MKKRSKMSRDARRFAALQQLHTVPVTPVTRHDTDYASFIAEENRREQAAAEAADPTRQAEKANVAAMTKVAIEFRERLKKLYRDVPTIEDYIRHDIEELVDDIGLPTQNPPVTMAEFEDRLRAFVEGLPKSVTFDSDVAKRKFELYAFVAARQGTVIDNSTLQTLLERAETLDIGVTLPRATRKPSTVEPSATPTWNGVQGLSTEDREQRKQVLQAVSEDFTSEVAAFFGLWRQQLARDYGYVMPDPVIKRALQYVTDQNMNPLRHETWNIVRRVFTKNGWMLTPDGSLMLTEREKLSELADRSDLNDREVRRQINLKNREILESEPAFAPHK